MDIWYYEYEVKCWDEVDLEGEKRRGVVPAENMKEAIDLLTEYYGELVEINLLKPIFEGYVIDFNDVEGFSISTKEGE